MKAKKCVKMAIVLLLALTLTGCKSETYKNAYADAIARGKSEIYATAYAGTMDDKKSETFADAYAEAIDDKKPIPFAKVYAESRTRGKSKEHAMAYAEGWAVMSKKENSEMLFLSGYPTFYAKAIVAGKTRTLPKAMPIQKYLGTAKFSQTPMARQWGKESLGERRLAMPKR